MTVAGLVGAAAAMAAVNIMPISFEGGLRMVLLLRRLAAVAALLAVAMAAASCVSGEEQISATPAPTFAPSVDQVSPALTRSANDILRQSRHMATIIAARPTRVPITGVGSASVVGVSSGQVAVKPTPVGVWWWRDAGGDFTPSAVLKAHPNGVHLDLLDGVLDYHEPVGHYGGAADYYRETVAHMLVREALLLLRASDALEDEPSADVLNDIVEGVGRTLGWEVVDSSQPWVRYWGSWDWEGRSYRLGAVVRFDVAPWPYGIVHGTSLVEGALPAEIVGSPVLERVK